MHTKEKTQSKFNTILKQHLIHVSSVVLYAATTGFREVRWVDWLLDLFYSASLSKISR